ncbi:MAG TPA: hypothetical protein VMV31_14315 [Terriglobales bacterium]|nr:hypothetical protein [Terriglobales bacterium]
MRTANQHAWFRAYGLLVAAGLLAAGAQAQKLTMPTSKIAPAATIQLNLDKDSNGNTTVELDAKNLAQPKSLQPAMSIYLVWVQAPGQAPQAKGMLAVNQDLDGELKFITPLSTFVLFITAERDGQVEVPSSTEITRAAVARAQ